MNHEFAEALVMTTAYSPWPAAGVEFRSDAYPGGSVPATFDAFLQQPTHNFEQLMRKIRLEITLRQMPQSQLPVDNSLPWLWAIRLIPLTSRKADGVSKVATTDPGSGTCLRAS